MTEGQDRGSLHLGLQPGDAVAIGPDIEVVYVKKNGRYAVLAIRCPKDIKIWRKGGAKKPQPPPTSDVKE